MGTFIEKDAGSGGPFCHHFHYGYWGRGIVDEGIRQRVRQGIGGPETIEVGADVIGHYHIPSGETVVIGDTIFVADDQGKKWEVKLDLVNSEPKQVVQNEPDNTGISFSGNVIQELATL